MRSRALPAIAVTMLLLPGLASGQGFLKGEWSGPDRYGDVAMRFDSGGGLTVTKFGKNQDGAYEFGERICSSPQTGRAGNVVTSLGDAHCYDSARIIASKLGLAPRITRWLAAVCRRS